MKFHEIYPHNKFLFYTGAILLFTGTYLDSTNKASNNIIFALLIIGLLLMLVSLKKPKQSKSD
jgi:hypothetical protein